MKEAQRIIVRIDEMRIPASIVDTDGWLRRSAADLCRSLLADGGRPSRADIERCVAASFVPPDQPDEAS